MVSSGRSPFWRDVGQRRRICIMVRRKHSWAESLIGLCHEALSRETGDKPRPLTASIALPVFRSVCVTFNEVPALMKFYELTICTFAFYTNHVHHDCYILMTAHQGLNALKTRDVSDYFLQATYRGWIVTPKTSVKPLFQLGNTI